MLVARMLGPDDWPLWREMRLAALANAPHAFGATLAEWQGEGDREDRWRSRLAVSGMHLVVFLDDSPAGMASGVPSEEVGAIEIISIWVVPQARGRGVGDRLLCEVEKWAREHAATSLRLSVMSGNPEASALYLRNGFADSGEPCDPLPDGRHKGFLAKLLTRD